MKRLLVIAAVLLLGGCMTRAEHEAQVGGIKRAVDNEGKEYLEWSAAIAKQPGAKPLPDLSKFSQGARDAWYRSRALRREALDKLLRSESGEEEPGPADLPVVPSPAPGPTRPPADPVPADPAIPD